MVGMALPTATRAESSNAVNMIAGAGEDVTLLRKKKQTVYAGTIKNFLEVLSVDNMVGL